MLGNLGGAGADDKADQPGGEACNEADNELYNEAGTFADAERVRARD